MTLIFCIWVSTNSWQQQFDSVILSSSKVTHKDAFVTLKNELTLSEGLVEVKGLSLEFNPNAAGLFEGSFFCGVQFWDPSPFIFQELIQCQFNFMQLLSNLFKVG